jgi:hypothetical protein
VPAIGKIATEGLGINDVSFSARHDLDKVLYPAAPNLSFHDQGGRKLEKGGLRYLESEAQSRRKRRG